MQFHYLQSKFILHNDKKTSSKKIEQQSETNITIVTVIAGALSGADALKN